VPGQYLSKLPDAQISANDGRAVAGFARETGSASLAGLELIERTADELAGLVSRQLIPAAFLRIELRINLCGSAIKQAQRPVKIKKLITPFSLTVLDAASQISRRKGRFFR